MNLKNNLQNKYIAYLDVLGFKELVYSNSDTLETYFVTVKQTLRDLKNEKRNIKSLLISDSTILIAPNNKTDFKILVRAVQTIQSRLAQKNIWLRGAISFGEVYFDKTSNLVVGKGLIKAYLLESEALYSRVIIDTSIILKIAENRSDFFHFMNPDFNNGFDEGSYKLIHDYHDITENDAFYVSFGHKLIVQSVYDRNVHVLYQRVMKNLYSEPKNYKKYLWLKNYISDVLKEYSSLWKRLIMKSPSSIEHKANKEYVDKWLLKFIDM